jgi:hypothetical protein
MSSLATNDDDEYDGASGVELNGMKPNKKKKKKNATTYDGEDGSGSNNKSGSRLVESGPVENTDDAASPAVDTDDDDDEEDQSLTGGGGGNRRGGAAAAGWGRRRFLRTVSHDEYEYDYIVNGDGDLDRVSFFVPTRKVVILVCFFVVGSILAIFIPKQRDETTAVRKYKGSPQFVCPAVVVSSSNPVTGTGEDSTSGILAVSSKRSITPFHVFPDYRNNTDFMNPLMAGESNLTTAYFEEREYMDWNRTYSQVREGMRHWKVSRYLPNLKTGDSIFESGCGIGLNLLLTLEILSTENRNLRDLHLYGTDFGASAAGLANVLLDTVLVGDDNYVGSGRRGIVCAADSTKLQFIPDNAFELVFASHISPSPEPWSVVDEEQQQQLDDGNAEPILDRNATWYRRRDICAADKDTDWKSASLSRVADQEQEDWYGQWIAEMVRVAKPGSPVIVEFVTDPYCDVSLVPDEWGVPYSFWIAAVDAYGWEIEPESIDFEPVDPALFTRNRYHVFMRKRKRP